MYTQIHLTHRISRPINEILPISVEANYTRMRSESGKAVCPCPKS